MFDLSSWYGVGAVVKVVMLIDAVRRGAAQYWYWVILFVPFGELVYCGLVTVPELQLHWRDRQRRRRPSLEALRYRLRENPCVENEALLAEGLLEAGEAREAEALFESALRSDSSYLKGIFGVADCRLQLGKWREAAEAFRQVVERERSYHDYAAFRKLAEALARDGRRDEAIATLETLVQADARLEHVLMLADELRAVGRVAQARARLEQALEDYRHAPRHVRRSAGGPARRATKLLGELA